MEPLPQRRTLDEKSVANYVRQHWNLDQVANHINMLDFHEDCSRRGTVCRFLRDALKGRGISKVLQFPDVPPDRGIDVSLF
jgi:hypothetical protein